MCGAQQIPCGSGLAREGVSPGNEKNTAHQRQHLKHREANSMIQPLSHLPHSQEDPAALAARFSDLAPPLNARQAHLEASRCLYCYDAPCVNACPSEIDIPSFIRNIHQDNVQGAAQKILSANILGGSCARVCPTEILCQQACVRNNAHECAPVLIGLLQRYAVRSEEHTSELQSLMRTSYAALCLKK